MRAYVDRDEYLDELHEHRDATPAPERDRTDIETDWVREIGEVLDESTTPEDEDDWHL